jgi:hypothetical protein
MFTKCDEVAMVYAKGKPAEAVLRWAAQKSSENLPLLPILAKHS